MLVSDIFSKRLKEARKAKGFTQQDLADALDVTEVTIRNYEAGRTFPKLDLLDAMQDILEKPAWWFFSEEGRLPKIEDQRLIDAQGYMAEAKSLLEVAQEKLDQVCKSEIERSPRGSRKGQLRHKAFDRKAGSEPARQDDDHAQTF